jgi:hypothetical protein
MRVQICPGAIEREHDEQLRIHARGRNVFRGQPVYRVFQDVTKLHKLISP